MSSLSINNTIRAFLDSEVIYRFTGITICCVANFEINISNCNHSVKKLEKGESQSIHNPRNEARDLVQQSCVHNRSRFLTRNLFSPHLPNAQLLSLRVHIKDLPFLFHEKIRHTNTGITITALAGIVVGTAVSH